MKKIIVLLMSLIVSLLVTVAEASVNQCEVIKGPQIEALCVDVGFDQTAINYDAYFPILYSAESTAIKQPYTTLRTKAERKTESLTQYLKKSGTARICSLETIQYTNLRKYNQSNHTRDTG